MERERCQEFLLRLITLRPRELLGGHTTLFMWRDREHMMQWYEMETPEGEDMRIVRLPSCHLPDLHTMAGVDYERAAIVGLALSKEANYSDCRVIHHMAVERLE